MVKEAICLWIGKTSKMSKIILVTGGNRGIGLGICKQLESLGHQVIMGSRSLEAGNLVKHENSLSVEVEALDVASPQSLLQAAKKIMERHKKLDVLINNAGIMSSAEGAPTADLSDARKVMETNFFGPWQMVQAFLPLLNKSEDSRIINMSSGMGALADLTSGYAGYRLSKTSLNGLTLLLSSELPAIKVNAMCPGWVRTDMGGQGAHRSVEQGADTAVWLATAEGVPTGRFFRDRKEISW